jgi:N-glycosylase/DNA lyase
VEFTINLYDSPFNLDYTLTSGQVFRWEKKGDEWEGVISDTLVRIRQEGQFLFCVSGGDRVDSSYLMKYFRLDEDMNFILGKITIDETIKRAVRKFYGLRLIRQDPWECLICFLLATNANIPRIKRMINSLCSAYGNQLSAMGISYFSFPKPEILAEAKEEELRNLGIGYRAKYIVSVSKSVNSGKVNFENLKSLNYTEARNEILSEFQERKILSGVGNKVADCVLLFSLGKDESFPIDTWILKALRIYYPKFCNDIKGKKLSNKDYQKLSERMRSYFGTYAGFAQQYLYLLSRSEL